MSAPLRLKVIRCEPYRERIYDVDCVARQRRAVDPSEPERVRELLRKCLTCARNPRSLDALVETTVAGVKVSAAALSTPLPVPPAHGADAEGEAPEAPRPSCCTLSFCGRTAETPEGLCGYHDAMERGEEALAAWRAQRWVS